MTISEFLDLPWTWRDKTLPLREHICAWTNENYKAGWYEGGEHGATGLSWGPIATRVPDHEITPAEVETILIPDLTQVVCNMGEDRIEDADQAFRIFFATTSLIEIANVIQGKRKKPPTP